DYLGLIAREAPLRADYADFLRFVPTRLGDALEVGSGYGVLAWALAPRARRYVCLDLDRRMFASLRRDLGQTAVVGDMHALPFAGGRFDSIIANNVLEHMSDPLHGLEELARVTRPGGRLLSLIPLDALNNRHDLRAHFWKTDAAGIEAAFSSAGWRTDRLEP